jgi:tRNA (guanine-N7-)-methyltransferase
MEMRLKYKPWAREYIGKNAKLFIQDETQLNEYLKDAKTVHMELGSGKGRFIHSLAKNNPEITYIGVEKFESVITSCGEKLEKEPLDNLIFWAIDVEKLPEFKILDHKVDLVYLNFSDPWPKKRHTKRRLTSEVFLKVYNHILTNDGHIQFKTDNQALFEYSLESISSNGFNISNISLDLHKTDRENIVTEYEEKFSNLGFRINYLEARRRENEGETTK